MGKVHIEGNPRNSRNPPAFAGKSVPQEKSRAVFR